jgi:hypothetical protein
MPLGSFTQGTCPRHRLYSLVRCLYPNHLCQPPSPAHSAAARAVIWLSPGLRYYSAVRRLAAPRFPLRLSTYRVTYPGATREHDEPSWGHVQIFRTVPPAHTLVRRVGKSAFAAIVPARPCPAFGRPVHHGVAPSITARYFSSSPSDSTSRWTPCPPVVSRQYTRLRVRLGCLRRFRLRARLDISHRLPTARPDTLAVTVRTRCGRLDVVSATPSPPSAACAPPHRRLEPLATENGEINGSRPRLIGIPRPERRYPRFRIWRPLPERPWDFNPPDLGAAQHTLRASPPPQGARPVPHGRPVGDPAPRHGASRVACVFLVYMLSLLPRHSD